MIRKLDLTDVDALWLSGSAVRGKFRRESDVDWVVVTPHPFDRDDWPSPRHAFQSYAPESFLRSLVAGHEFSVWQLAYGLPIFVSPAYRQLLHGTQVAGAETGAARKEAMIARRARAVRMFLHCGASEDARNELFLIAHQQLRLAIIRAGYVPGCRAEIVEQVQAVAPAALDTWRRASDALGDRHATSHRNVASLADDILGQAA